MSDQHDDVMTAVAVIVIAAAVRVEEDKAQTIVGN
jgi:hypothetical protein